MASLAQIAANRANALQSTGPRTTEGEDRSRRNAIKHGLASETLVLPGEEAEAVAARIAAWSPSLEPVGEYDAWLVGEVVVNSVRIDRCRAQEAAIRTRSADRAALCWDVDREADAEELGATLAKSPAVVLHRLRATKQGCAWLIGRWEGLRGALDAKGDWDAPQIRLALDLLGTPKEFRNGPTPIDGDRRALVAEQLSRLETLKVGAMEPLDELERSAAEVGLGPDRDRSLALTRRYEAACARRMEWARKQLGQGQPARIEPNPPPKPREVSEPAPPAAEAPSPIIAEAAPTPPVVSNFRRMSFSATPGPVNRNERRALKAIIRRA